MAGLENRKRAVKKDILNNLNRRDDIMEFRGSYVALITPFTKNDEVDEEKIRELRQTMMSCTVENKEKQNLDKVFTKNAYEKANEAFENQKELQTIIKYLDEKKEAKELNNPGIARMVKNYFYETTLIIFECARILKKGSPFVMVNDNVRYNGLEVPVDLLLSEIASNFDLVTEKIWVLPKGKGNSSQQMKKHGRAELRKCVYLWKKA